MATTTKGRGYNRTRSAFGTGYTGFSWGPGSSYGSYGRTGGTRKSGRSGGSWTGYKGICNTCEQKINSYRTLWNQAKGPASSNGPTPGTLNSFCNWINKGHVVQTCSPAQVWRWAQSTNKNFNLRNATPTACKTVLAAKFGKSCIKAVAKTKSGQFMVVTSPTLKGRTFNFPR
jgi:hypothetical protein